MPEAKRFENPAVGLSIWYFLEEFKQALLQDLLNQEENGVHGFIEKLRTENEAREKLIEKVSKEYDETRERNLSISSPDLASYLRETFKNGFGQKPADQVFDLSKEFVLAPVKKAINKIEKKKEDIQVLDELITPYLFVKVPWANEICLWMPDWDFVRDRQRKTYRKGEGFSLMPTFNIDESVTQVDEGLAAGLIQSIGHNQMGTTLEVFQDDLLKPGPSFQSKMISRFVHVDNRPSMWSDLFFGNFSSLQIVLTDQEGGYQGLLILVSPIRCFWHTLLGHDKNTCGQAGIVVGPGENSFASVSKVCEHGRCWQISPDFCNSMGVSAGDLCWPVAGMLGCSCNTLDELRKRIDEIFMKDCQGREVLYSMHNALEIQQRDVQNILLIVAHEVKNHARNIEILAEDGNKVGIKAATNRMRTVIEVAAAIGSGTRRTETREKFREAVLSNANDYRNRGVVCQHDIQLKHEEYDLLLLFIVIEALRNARKHHDKDSEQPCYITLKITDEDDELSIICRSGRHYISNEKEWHEMMNGAQVEKVVSRGGLGRPLMKECARRLGGRIHWKCELLKDDPEHHEVTLSYKGSWLRGWA